MNVSGVSYSSDRKLARCEMQYHYRYDEKIQKRHKKKGLFRGDWIHQLLETYYKFRRDGEQGPTWEDKLDDLVENVWNKMFDEQKEDYGDFPGSVRELFTHYVQHWETWDSGWEILAIEQDYQLQTRFGFPVRWKSDLIVREKDTGAYALIESKAKKAIPDSEERILQPQPHSYGFLNSKLGIKIDKIIWNYIRTEPVPRPKVNKDGSLSVRKINTDRRGYFQSLQDASITAETAEDWIGIQNHIETLPETLSLERVVNSINLKIGQRFVSEWIERANRAKLITRPLLTYTRDCKFDCDYYLLCQCDMRGKTDREHVLKTEYVQIQPRVREELK